MERLNSNFKLAILKNICNNLNKTFRNTLPYMPSEYCGKQQCGFVFGLVNLGRLKLHLVLKLRLYSNDVWMWLVTLHHLQTATQQYQIPPPHRNSCWSNLYNNVVPTPSTFFILDNSNGTSNVGAIVHSCFKPLFTSITLHLIYTHTTKKVKPPAAVLAHSHLPSGSVLGKLCTTQMP